MVHVSGHDPAGLLDQGLLRRFLLRNPTLCGTRRFLLLIGVTLLGLAPAACARVPSHFAVPQLAVADAAFIPTLEAYTLIPTPLSSSDLPVRRYVT